MLKKCINFLSAKVGDGNVVLISSTLLFLIELRLLLPNLHVVQDYVELGLTSPVFYMWPIAYIVLGGLAILTAGYLLYKVYRHLSTIKK